MPELHMLWAYPVLLVVMLLIAISLLVFFRRKEWI
jgi:Mg2+ and Co2+ transporter CorA